MSAADTKFAPWMLGLAASALVACGVAVGGVLWSMNTSITTLIAQGAEGARQNDDMKKRIETLDETVKAGTRDKYSSLDATKDRAAFMESCAADRKMLMDAVNTTRADLVLLLKNETETNRSQEDRIRAIEIWRARTEGAK